MNSSELGKRIKEARLAKKMTQSEVVGDFITRNMLSQIESGSAYPSIKTLEYLANKLELPINQIMPDNNPNLSEADSASISLLIKSKECLINGMFLQSAETISTLNVKGNAFYDESSAIMARCYLAIAKQLQQESKTSEAIRYAKQACDLADIGVYSSREIRTDALILLDSLASALQR